MDPSLDKEQNDPCQQSTATIYRNSKNTYAIVVDHNIDWNSLHNYYYYYSSLPHRLLLACRTILVTSPNRKFHLLLL